MIVSRKSGISSASDAACGTGNNTRPFPPLTAMTRDRAPDIHYTEYNDPNTYSTLMIWPDLFAAGKARTKLAHAYRNPLKDS